MDVIDTLFMTIFDGLATTYATELEAVQSQFPFEPIQAKPTRLTYAGERVLRHMMI
jgi:aspartyl-tRNA synthetase